MSLRILVVGAGAVGGYFGARLAQAGRDVTFLVRPGRAKQLRQDGLRIVSPHGDLALAPRLLVTGENAEPFDLILLSVKAYTLASAVGDFAPAVGPDTMILPVLNGMRHIETLAQRFGDGPILGGVCLVATELDAQGRIVQNGDIQQITYGERSGQTSTRLQRLDATLKGSGFDAHLSADIVQAMWEKWVQIASIGAVTCLFRGTIGDVVAAPGGRGLSLRVLEECSAIAAACGHPPSEVFRDRLAAALTAAGSGLTSSMYRDLRKGASVEADHILGDLIQRGAAQNMAAPLLEAAYVNLRVYQNGLELGRGSDR